MEIVCASDVDPATMRLDPITLNGRGGAWDLEFGDDFDESITFENAATLISWVSDLVSLASDHGIDILSAIERQS